MNTIRKGSVGGSVTTLQTLLGIAVDGKFGNGTKAAVVAYQTAHGLAADGIVGPATWAMLMESGPVLGVRPPDNKQYDARWARVLYTATGNKSQTVKSSGCGPTSMTDIINAWFDTGVTPVDLCKLAVKGGYRTRNSGTAWGFFAFMSSRYDFPRFRSTATHSEAIAALAQGALIVASMGRGYWTRGGHFICLWKCDQEYMYACDPASATRKRQKLTDFKRQVKRYFIFWPPADLGASDDVPAIAEPVTVEPALPAVTVANGIYDISKWQGKINWAKLAASGLVKLVIIRAGYGQETVDPRFVENVEGAIKYGVPYAVYWYSYAKAADGQSAVQRARNEADSFYRVTSKYSPRFWLLDAEEACLNGESINAFLVRIRALSDGKIGVYIANHRFAQYKVDTSLVDFVMIPRGNRIQPTHRPLDLWQYSFGSRVPGISGNVDQSKIPECGRFPLEWFLAAPERSVADISV